jgi:hypothetical protein
MERNTIAKLLTLIFGMLAVLIFLVGLFNMAFFVPCFGFGMLATVFFLLTAKILNDNEK